MVHRGGGAKAFLTRAGALFSVTEVWRANQAPGEAATKAEAEATAEAVAAPTVAPAAPAPALVVVASRQWWCRQCQATQCRNPSPE